MSSTTTPVSSPPITTPVVPSTAALPTTATTTIMTTGVAPSSTGSSSSSIPPTSATDVVKAKSKPPSYKMGGNVDTFLSRMDNYYKLCPALTDEVNIATLLAQLDEASYQVIQHCQIPEADKRSYDRYIGHVRARFGPKESEQEIRLNFRSLTQKSNQNFDEYYETQIRTAQKAFPRKNADIIDYQVRDEFIAGILNANVRIRLIEVSMTAKRF